MIRLSIVVVTWNTRDLTLRCLERIDEALGGRGAGDAPAIEYEVLVVDNGSEDGSAEAIRDAHPGVRLIALPENRGFARGNNVALAEVRGEFVLLLNSDALLQRAAVLRCLEVLDAEDDIGAVGPQLLHPDGRLQNSIHAFPSLLTEWVHTALLEWLWPARFPSKRHPPSGLTDVDAVLGAAFFVRRKVMEQVGPLCGAYFFFLEETDWCWRMHEAGWRVVHVPDARLVHLSGASSKRRNSARARIEYHRSLYRFLRRHRGTVTLVLSAGARVTRTALSLLLLTPLAAVSERQRERTRDRWQLLQWHLRGCPPEAGLEGKRMLDGNAAG